MGQKLINVYIGIKPRQKPFRQRINQVNEEFHWYLLIDAGQQKKGPRLQDSEKESESQWRLAYHLHAAEQHVAGTEVLEDQATPGNNATDRIEREHAMMVARIPLSKRSAFIEHIEAINTKKMNGQMGYRESCKDFIQRLVFFFTDESLQKQLEITVVKKFDKAAKELLNSVNSVDAGAASSKIDATKPPKLSRSKTSLLGWVQSKKDKEVEKDPHSKKLVISRPIPQSQVGRAASRQAERQNRQDTGEIVPFILDDPQSQGHKPLMQPSDSRHTNNMNGQSASEDRQPRSRERSERSRERSAGHNTSERHQDTESRRALDDKTRSISRSKSRPRRTDSRDPSGVRPRDGGNESLVENRPRAFVSSPEARPEQHLKRDERMLEGRSKSTSGSKERSIRREDRPAVPSRSVSEGTPRGRNVAVRIAPRSASEGRHRETNSTRAKPKDNRKQKLRISPPLSNPALAINPVSAVEE